MRGLGVWKIPIAGCANSYRVSGAGGIARLNPKTKKAHLAVSLSWYCVWCGTRSRTRDLLITSPK
jgi:hypothetical protein